jgi:hypothetical protein
MLGIAIAGFGFAGHIWTPPRIGVGSVESSTPPPIGQVLGPSAAPVVVLTVLNPAENEPSDGEVVSVLEVSSTTVRSIIAAASNRSQMREQTDVVPQHR